MIYAEFFGCLFLAFGTPLAMFIFTIAHDSIRIIILIASVFVWLLSVILSSLIWFAVVPLREYLAFGLVFSVLFQEGFRYLIYMILNKTERGLQAVADNARVTENKHILAYVTGLGFGIISGIFALDNVLADMWGPATMGLKGGSEIFFLASSAHTLCIILLHTFWSIIYFNGLNTKKYIHVLYVVLSHLFVSCMTLFNQHELYSASLIPNYSITILTGIFAFKSVGGSFLSFKKFIKCQ